MQKEKITCEHCNEEFEVTLEKLNCTQTSVGTICPHCGIRTRVSWQLYAELGGEAPE